MEFEFSKLIDHPGMKGKQREKIVGNLIKYFIPKRWKIEYNKKIFNIQGNQSSEIDLLVWDPENNIDFFSNLKKKRS